MEALALWAAAALLMAHGAAGCWLLLGGFSGPLLLGALAIFCHRGVLLAHLSQILGGVGKIFKITK